MPNEFGKAGYDFLFTVKMPRPDHQSFDMVAFVDNVSGASWGEALAEAGRLATAYGFAEHLVGVRVATNDPALLPDEKLVPGDLKSAARQFMVRWLWDESREALARMERIGGAVFKTGDGTYTCVAPSVDGALVATGLYDLCETWNAMFPQDPIGSPRPLVGFKLYIEAYAGFAEALAETMERREEDDVYITLVEPTIVDAAPRPGQSLTASGSVFSSENPRSMPHV